MVRLIEPVHPTLVAAMAQPAYPAARAAATRILPHFEQNRDSSASFVPPLSVLEAIIDAAFWASLRREEGFTPRISLAYIAPEHVSAALTFERSLPLAAQALVRLAPAVERPGTHLGVWCDGDDLRVWGATRNLPPFCFVLEVIAPGLLVIKHSTGAESGKFINVAVLEGDQVKVIDQGAAREPDCPAALTTLFSVDSQSAPDHSINVLIQLATSMRQHGRGGSLLVVPAATSAWQDSILSPITYSVVPPFSALADLMDADSEERPKRRWQDALRRAVDGIAGLTAVDGATLITDRYELLAFGVKIVPRPGCGQVGAVLLTEPIEGTPGVVTEPAQLGGTRHLSAAQFAQDQKDAIALVASQDGRFTVFAWSPCEAKVHAHRIETLLL